MHEKATITLPKITVVTPNFNGADFIEQTLDSVLCQGYPSLEYIIVDGGSTDRSMEIVRRHERHLALIISEQDTGHANALNKGLSRATGEIMCWINSDDVLLPGSLARVGKVFASLPQVEWLTGQRHSMSEDGHLRPTHPLKRWSWVRFLCGDFRHIQQESTFWRRSLWQRAGGRLDECLALANDFELWLRFFRISVLHTVDEPLGCFRFRSGQRSIVQNVEYERECELVMQAFVKDLPPALLARYAELIPPGQLASRAKRPRDLPEAKLAALDPPLVRIDEASGQADLDPGETPLPPAAFVADVESVEDLQFDGLDRVIWTDGPDFVGEKTSAVGFEIIPFVPNAHIPGGMLDETPPMPMLIEPLTLTDWGKGRVHVHVRGGSEPVELSLPDLGRTYRIAWVRVGERGILLLDGVAVAEEKLSKTMPLANSRVVLGGGFAQRFWIGSLDAISVTTTPLHGGTSVTRRLTHKEGVRRMTREVRTGLVSLPPRPFAEPFQPTPLSAWRNRHRGQRCFVMGNGPSLNRTNLSLLEGEIIFACNAAFLLFERVCWRPTYYTCVDTRVIRDRAEDINSMLDAHPSITAFFPSELHLHDGSGVRIPAREVIRPGTNRHFFNEVSNRETHHPETMFSLDADNHVVQPYTVAITMLQLAVYMGFSEIYLIGCDTSYKVGHTVRQEGRKIDGTGLLLTSTEDDDENHFDPRYFGRGREWHNPQVAQMLNHYRWARLAARRAGAHIRNATKGGQLEVFERVSYDSLFLANKVGDKPANGAQPASMATAPPITSPAAKLQLVKANVPAPSTASVKKRAALGVSALPTTNPQATQVATDLAYAADALRGELVRVAQEQSAQQATQVAADLARTAEELRGDLARVMQEQSAQQAAQLATVARTVEELRGELARVTKEQQEHQAAQAWQVRQVAAKFARTTEELRGELARVTKEQTEHQGAQVAQVAADLARTADELRGELDRVTKEQSAQQAAQVSQVAADVARIAEEFRGDLARVTKEQQEYQAAQAWQVRQVGAKLARMAEELRGELARVTKEQSAQQAAQAAKVAADVARTAEELRGELVRVTKAQQAHEAAQRRMEEQDADIRREVRDGLSRSARAAELVRVEQTAAKNAERIVSELGTTKKGLEQTVVEQEKLSRSMAMFQVQQEAQNARLTHPQSYAFNGLGYQAFSRQLTKANAERLAEHWAPMLGLTVQKKELYYLAHRICQTENTCLGRLATSIDSVLLRTLVVRASGGPKLEVLEIGTLFGLGLIALHEAVKPLCAGLHFTAIDPLDGYYGKEHRDIVTGVPISRAVLDENLRRAGMTKQDVTLIQHLSTDNRALRQARVRRYAVVIIDGDHGYAGVKHDFESYLKTVKPGGYVILDDYGNPSWPDVKAYVDAEVMGRKDVEYLGTDWQTAVFRVRNAR